VTGDRAAGLVTIPQILARAPKKFDFLSIDVEGHDREVLQSIDLGQYQPEVILIEISGEMSAGAIFGMCCCEASELIRR
jgi:hypothetical protein